MNKSVMQFLIVVLVTVGIPLGFMGHASAYPIPATVDNIHIVPDDAGAAGITFSLQMANPGAFPYSVSVHGETVQFSIDVPEGTTVDSFTVIAPGSASGASVSTETSLTNEGKVRINVSIPITDTTLGPTGSFPFYDSAEKSPILTIKFSPKPALGDISTEMTYVGAAPEIPANGAVPFGIVLMGILLYFSKKRSNLSRVRDG